MPVLLCRGDCSPVRSRGLGASRHHTAPSLWGNALARTAALEPAGRAGRPQAQCLLREHGRCLRRSPERQRRSRKALGADRRNLLVELVALNQAPAEHSSPIALGRGIMAGERLDWDLRRLAEPSGGTLAVPPGRARDCALCLVRTLLGPLDLSPWIKQLHWVICGGESGIDARPMNPDWARSLRDQCLSAGVPFFFNQWGGRYHNSGGRLLDGRIWHEMPPERPGTRPEPAREVPACPRSM